MLVRLWRELHPNDPVQLTFRNERKKENSKGCLEEASLTLLPLLVARCSQAELIGSLRDSERIENLCDSDTAHETRS
jgi:hypothetical protein